MLSVDWLLAVKRGTLFENLIHIQWFKNHPDSECLRKLLSHLPLWSFKLDQCLETETEKRTYMHMYLCIHIYTHTCVCKYILYMYICIYRKRWRQTQEMGRDRHRRWGNQIFSTMIILKVPVRADLLKLVHRIHVNMQWSPAQFSFHIPSSEICISFSPLLPTLEQNKTAKKKKKKNKTQNYSETGKTETHRDSQSEGRCSVISVQLLTHVWLFVITWTTACQGSLSITSSQSLLKFMSIKSTMPSNHLILCRPLLLLSFPPMDSSSNSLIRSPEINPHTHRHLIFDKRDKNI